MSLLSAEELAEIRTVGESGMTTLIQIYRASGPVEPADSEYVAIYDYGDDDYTEPDTATSAQLVATVMGWMVSKLQPQTRIETAELVTIDQHELRVPVGTDIRVRDTVKVVASGSEYHVIDTSADDTWPEWTKATLRRSE